ncbi:MAG: bifunctional aspartate transaminase/aspartate 4-decarboxylase [Planctomycetaceae bacterium]|nr:bifunctional aspartate transaminase/aspartate 4-decarboxylase [Planctomycetaceae bacterium]
MDEKIDYAELADLSPFELKNTLIDVAAKSIQKPMLNAGRGNPNFLATIPRRAFFRLGDFAMQEAENSWVYMPEGVGGFPQRDGIEARFDIFAHADRDDVGIKFLRSAVSYVRDHLGLAAGDFIYEMCEGILGCNYPVPDRMLTISEMIVNQYLRKEMIGNHAFRGEFDLFATEGGTAAMTYLFNSLRENYLLGPGDHIALGLPIFTPYIEIPKLNDYRLVTVPLQASEENRWQFPTSELDKLLDSKVKAFFLVNLSNPPSVRLSDDNLRRIENIVAKRPDLIILTDDVYGTFADNFTSLFAVCPRNTILVYSFSKYFGATGWRMGTIAINRDNVIDDMIQNLGADEKKELHDRYESIAPNPDSLRFIDRLVADSRTVALNHTAGLATPVQVQMVMFALFSLMDQPDAYKAAMKRLIHSRNEKLYNGFCGTPPFDEDSVDYYQLLDVEEIYRKEYGEEFAQWYVKSLKPNQALFRLADEAGVVLLPAEGFGTTRPAFRVSLANLTEVEYRKIGQAIDTIGREYYEEFSKSKPKK